MVWKEALGFGFVVLFGGMDGSGSPYCVGFRGSFCSLSF